MRPFSKYLFLSIGLISMALGFLGVFLPILPTTPFMILAAFCFSKSSDRLHSWLIKRPHIGKLILDWQNDGRIRKKVKLASTLVIIPLFSYSLTFVKVSLFVKTLLALIGIGVLYFIWSRPSFPNKI